MHTIEQADKNQPKQRIIKKIVFAIISPIPSLLYLPPIQHSNVFDYFRYIHIQKRRGDRACCSFHVSRLSHCPIHQNEQRRSPTPIHIYTQPVFPYTLLYIGKTGKGICTYPWSIYRCFVFDELKNLRDSDTPKPKRQVNALFNMFSPPCSLPDGRAFGVEMGQRYTFLVKNEE